VHVAELGDLLVGGGEAKAAGFEPAPEHGLQPWFVDRELTVVQPADLVDVDVEAQDVESEVSPDIRSRSP
jgi:hypothetical protein